MIRKNALYLAWLISLIGFCMSVFYGEILGNAPCPLCWYQRLSLFPLVILLGMAVYRGDSMIVPYALPIACFGGVVAIVHSLQPYVAFLRGLRICSLGTPCTHSGFSLLFPAISALGFFLIAIFLLLASKKHHD